MEVAATGRLQHAVPLLCLSTRKTRALGHSMCCLVLSATPYCWLSADSTGHRPIRTDARAQLLCGFCGWVEMEWLPQKLIRHDEKDTDIYWHLSRLESRI